MEAVVAAVGVASQIGLAMALIPTDGVASTGRDEDYDNPLSSFLLENVNQRCICGAVRGSGHSRRQLYRAQYGERRSVPSHLEHS